MELQHFSIHEGSDVIYDALSYVWGPQDHKQSVQINGGQYLVRQNLFDFLSEARRREYQQWIWVDQLSIIQDDTEERNHQVSLMGKIFTHARSTISWLSCEDTTFADTMSQIIDIHLSRPRNFGRTWLKKYGTSHDHGHSVAVANSFCENPYWTRLWIIQELKLSSRLLLWWGERAFSADECLAALRTEPFNPNYRLCNGRHDSLRIESLLFRKAPGSNELPRSTNEKHRLQDVIDWIENTQCEDPRDFMFGIQSILQQESRMEVDYTRTVVDVHDEALSILVTESDIVGFRTIFSDARQIRILRRTMFGEDYDTAHAEAVKFTEYVTRELRAARSSRKIDFDHSDAFSFEFMRRRAEHARLIGDYRRLQNKADRRSKVKAGRARRIRQSQASIEKASKRGSPPAKITVKKAWEDFSVC